MRDASFHGQLKEIALGKCHTGRDVNGHPVETRLWRRIGAILKSIPIRRLYRESITLYGSWHLADSRVMPVLVECNSRPVLRDLKCCLARWAISTCYYPWLHWKPLQCRETSLVKSHSPCFPFDIYGSFYELFPPCICRAALRWLADCRKRGESLKGAFILSELVLRDAVYTGPPGTALKAGGKALKTRLLRQRQAPFSKDSKLFPTGGELQRRDEPFGRLGKVSQEGASRLVVGLLCPGLGDG